MANEVNQGLYRFGGMYGAAYDNSGQLLSEVVEVTGNVAINRLDIPLVGQTKGGYKPGRETREGTLRLQKIDTSWEMKVWNYLSQNLDQRRANRDSGTPNLRPFTIQLEYDDPDAIGIEKWSLEGCLLWQMPIGFAITDDVKELDFPLTWERETPIYAFSAKRTTIPGQGTVLSPSWYTEAPPGFKGSGP